MINAHSTGVVSINQDDVMKMLQKAGWIDTGRGKGSHKVFVNPDTGQVTTIPHNKNIPKGVLAAIRRQTGIKEIR